MRALGVLIGVGIGAVICAALWPLVLICALIVFVVKILKLSTEKQKPVREAKAGKLSGPVLGDLRTRSMAVVHERNKAHLERCLAVAQDPQG